MYQITLDKDDYLRFQLFTASKSKRIRTKRVRGWILTTISFFCLGIILFQNEDKFLTYYFLIAALISLIFYPFYNRWRYKKHYEKHIEENYKNKIGIISEIGFDNGYLISKDQSGEGKIKLTEIEIMNEIRDNLFIKVKSGETVIIPSRIAEYQGLKNELTRVSKDLAIKWVVESEWKWK